MITEIKNILKIFNTTLNNFSRINDDLLIDLENNIIVKINNGIDIKENMIVLYDNSNTSNTKIYNRMLDEHTSFELALRSMMKCGRVPVIATSDFCIIKR